MILSQVANVAEDLVQRQALPATQVTTMTEDISESQAKIGIKKLLGRSLFVTSVFTYHLSTLPWSTNPRQKLMLVTAVAFMTWSFYPKFAWDDGLYMRGLLNQSQSLV